MSKLWQASYHGLLQISSIRTLGGTLPLGPKNPKVKCQALPCDGPVRLKQPILASPPVTDNLHRIGTKGATGCGRWVWELSDQHQDCPLCPELLFWRLLLQIHTILVVTVRRVTKRSIPALLYCWGEQKFSHQFLVIPECPTPLLGRDTLQAGEYSCHGRHLNPQGFTTSDDNRGDCHYPSNRESSRTLGKWSWPPSLGPRCPWARTLSKAHHYNPQKPIQFPSWEWYSIKKEARARLQLLICKFLSCRLLIPTNSTWDTTISTLKEGLIRAPALRLPDEEKSFQLYSHEREGMVLGALTQRLKSKY